MSKIKFEENEDMFESSFEEDVNTDDIENDPDWHNTPAAKQRRMALQQVS